MGYVEKLWKYTKHLNENQRNQTEIRTTTSSTEVKCCTSGKDFSIIPFSMISFPHLPKSSCVGFYAKKCLRNMLGLLPRKPLQRQKRIRNDKDYVWIELAENTKNHSISEVFSLCYSQIRASSAEVFNFLPRQAPGFLEKQ